MAEMKNICGKIPLELHAKVRQEIEQREISTQQFIQQVIEEHFTEKGGQVSMAVRTVAVQVSEELFARFKAAVAKKGCRQKDFLIALIEKAVEEIEAEFGDGKVSGTPDVGTENMAEETEPEEPEGSAGTEPEEAQGPMEAENEAPDEPAETGAETGEADGSGEEASAPESPESGQEETDTAMEEAERIGA